MQQLGLAVRYKEDDVFNCIVRRASALPLLPRDEIDNVWIQTVNESDDPDVVRFCDYVTQTWVDEIVAIFPVEL